MTDIETYFPKIIGQEKTKRKLAFFLDGYKETGIFPNSMIIAPKGSGKTVIAKALGKNLISRQTGKPKRFIEINCATLANTRQWINQVVIPYMQEKECTIFFDEASEIPAELEMNLLTILNPNPDEKNRFAIDDFVYEFDFRRHTFIFATTEGQDVFHALLDRLERFELEEYTPEQLGQIVLLGLPEGYSVTKEALRKMTGTLRGNARTAQSCSSKINVYLKSQKRRQFTELDWEKFKHTLGILPLGLSNIELQILRILGNGGPGRGFSLTQLSSMTDLTRKALQGDIERHLLKNDLMAITTTGRSITKKGIDYLKENVYA